MYSILPQIYAVLTASIIPVAVTLISTKGLSTAFTTYAFQDTIIGVVLVAAALIGSFAGAFLIEFLGRKTTLLAIVLPLIVSWLLIAIKEHDFLVYAALTILECSKAVAETAVLVYTVEILRYDVRGGLTLLPRSIASLVYLLFLIFKMLFSMDNLAFFVSFALMVPFLVFMFLTPESPRWYALRGKTDHSKKALQWLRGADANIAIELNEIKTTVELNNSAFSKQNIKPCLIAFGLLYFQQFSGLNAVVFSAFYVFRMSGISMDDSMYEIIINCVIFVTLVVAMLLVDKVGRKILLLISQGGMATAAILSGLFFYLRDREDAALEEFWWIALCSYIIFLVAFYLGCGSVSWLVIGEIFGTKIRGPAVAACIGLNYILGILSIIVQQSITSYNPFAVWLFFGINGFLGLLFVLSLLPETKEESLEDIEKYIF